MSKQQTFVATITFTSGETIDDDNHMSVVVSFDPPETAASLSPPAFVIARKVFTENVKDAINEYLEQLEKEPEYEYVPLDENGEPIDSYDEDEDFPEPTPAKSRLN